MVLLGRIFVVSLLGLSAACGGDDGGGLTPPDMCGAGRLAWVDTLAIGERTMGGGDFGLANMIFVNAINGELGQLEVSDGAGSRVRVEFPDLLADGSTGPARGIVELATGSEPIMVGNCDSGDFPGELTINEDGVSYQFRLSGLRQAPYCSGAGVDGEFAACYQEP
jgi:hypothetical protein